MNGFTDVCFNALSAKDVAELLRELALGEAEGTYHVAARDRVSKYAFALQIAKLFALDPSLVIPVSVDAFGFKAPRPKDTSLNTDKLSAFIQRKLPSVEESLGSFKEELDSGEVARLKGEAPEWLTPVFKSA
jgi:dTDP-4-dehydrorhamnose reductase